MKKGVKLLARILVITMILGCFMPTEGFAASYKKNFPKGVDLIVFSGQSNMMGHGNAAEAPKLTKGAAYEYKVVTAKNKISTLTEPFGYRQDSGHLVNGAYATGSMVTAFCNAYYKQTRVPVVAVNATVIGSGSVGWSTVLYKDVIKRVKQSYKAMQKMKIPVNHVYLVWMQGENDVCAGTPAKDYEERIGGMLQTIVKKSPVEKCMLIQTGSIVYNIGAGADADSKEILLAQQNICNNCDSVVMISKIAPKLGAQYYQNDRIHFTQQGLNKIGTDAGKKAGAYRKKQNK